MHHKPGTINGIPYHVSEINKAELAKLVGKTYPLILDVGCHDGSDAAEMLTHFKDPTIHCFEPDPRVQQRFKNKIHPPAMILHPLALCNFNGLGQFHQSIGRNIASGSIKTPTGHMELFPDVKFNNTISVRCLTLDRWYVLNLNPANIDLIWCDVNGAELDFIRGGKGTLGYHTRFVYIEFEEKELYEGAAKLDEVLRALPSFELVGVFNFQGNFGNVLLKNKFIL